ncbi:MAG: hypothetical protein WCV67_14315 [Victivallaceae bacterium]|jgi:hypothetical protein
MRLLRIFLMVGALSWGICIVGVFLPWSLAVEYLQELGAGNPGADPMLNYWFRMACGGFFMIGCMFASAAYNPGKYRVLIPWLGWLSIIEGGIIGVHGLRLGLPPLPFYCDTGFCLLVGAGIVILHRKVSREIMIQEVRDEYENAC